jgi:hypothetical protein
MLVTNSKMRVALLVVALLALASCASAQRFVQVASFDEFGATDSKFLCVGNATYNNVTTGDCKGGTIYYCDGTYIYQFSYTNNFAADPLCMSGNLTSISRSPAGCGIGSGVSSMTCMNTTQLPEVPAVPSDWPAFTRSNNWNYTYTPDSNPKVTKGYTTDCSNSQYYSETTNKPVVVDPCTKLTGNKAGYSSPVARTCDANYIYSKTYDTTTCTGNIVNIAVTPYKTSPATCNKFSGVMIPGVGPCASPSTPATPSYANNDGNVYAVYTTYNDNGCKSANFTTATWDSSACQGTNKYVCTNSTAYPVLVRVDYNDGVLCSGSFFQNVTLTTGCQDSGASSSSWQCLAASGGSQGGSASSISVSFVTLMIAAFVAMVARQ